MFAPGLPDVVQIPVIQALANQGLDRDFEALTQRWHLWDPTAQLATINTLLETERGADALLTAIADGAIPAEALTSIHVNLLRDHPSEMIQTRARRVFGAVAPDRSGLVSDVLGALDLQGSIARGGELFNTRCVHCHRPGEAAVGPSPERMRARSAPQLLAGIVDPSRETAPNHQTTVLQLSNGRRVWGAAGELGDEVIHLATPEGSRRYRRSAVSFIDRPDWSLMPDNAAAGLTLRDLADLVGYLQGSGTFAEGN
jgi:putative heme-binding domain-containing protein